MSGTERFPLPINSKSDSGRASILVVDDDELVRDFLTSTLDEWDYNVKGVEDCDQAKALLAKEEFSLILCDVNLPGMSGDEFLPFCRSNYPSTEIILITGNPGIDAAVHAVKEGAFDYLPKPISLETLQDRVASALAKNAADTSGGRRGSVHSPVEGYKIIKSLGSGAMGVVFLVEKAGMQYALKMLRADIASDKASQRYLKRFERETKILAGLNHPNIVRLLEYGMWRDENIPYFIMEFVSGEPLSYHIKAGTLTIKEKISIMRQVASALDFIHAHGILHRDIKPANVLITEDNVTKITDFGIARISNSELTITQEALGSPAYMSPEAFGGAEQYVQSDIFSFGSVCYELFTGRRPFDGDTIAEMMDSIKYEHPIEPLQLAPDIPPYIQDVLAKMLAKKPEDRFAAAKDIIRALDRPHAASDVSSITSRLFKVLLLRKPTWR